MTVIEASSPSTTGGHLWQIFFNHIGEDSTHSFPGIYRLILKINVCRCPAMFSMFLSRMRDKLWQIKKDFCGGSGCFLDNIVT